MATGGDGDESWWVASDDPNGVVTDIILVKCPQADIETLMFNVILKSCGYEICFDYFGEITVCTLVDKGKVLTLGVSAEDGLKGELYALSGHLTWIL